jgi:hypothetical protein
MEKEVGEELRDHLSNRLQGYQHLQMQHLQQREKPEQ